MTMKLSIRSDSWHYRLVASTGTAVPTTLCDYLPLLMKALWPRLLPVLMIGMAAAILAFGVWGRELLVSTFWMHAAFFCAPLVWVACIAVSCCSFFGKGKTPLRMVTFSLAAALLAAAGVVLYEPHILSEPRVPFVGVAIAAGITTAEQGLGLVGLVLLTGVVPGALGAQALISLGEAFGKRAGPACRKAAAAARNACPDLTFTEPR